MNSLRNDLQRFLRKQCFFKNQIKKHSHFVEIPVKLEVCTVIDENIDFGTYLLQNTAKAIELLADALREEHANIGTVIVNVSISDVPSLDYFAIHKAEDVFLKKNSKHLLFIDDCQLVSLSVPYSHVVMKMFNCSCPSKQSVYSFCEITDEVRNNVACFDCGSEMEEDVNRRVSVQKRDAIVVKNDRSFNCLPIVVHFPQWATESTVFLGSRMDRIIGVVVRKSTTVSLEVIGIEHKVRYPITKLKIDVLPKPMRRLYKEFASFPCNFAFSLSYFFGENTVPKGTFSRVKLGLLMSVIGIGDETSESSVLTLCEDTTAVDRLYRFASQFVENHYIHSSCSLSVCGTSRVERGKKWFDAGSLALASNGVCLFAEGCSIDMLSEKERHSLEYALETNEIIIPEINGVDIHKSPLKSSIWSYSPSLSTIPLLAETIGMCYVEESGLRSDDVDFSISFEDWKKFFSFVKSVEKPNVPAVVDRLLRNFFCAIRKVRGNCVHRHSLDVLVSLTINFAKLSIRTTVTKFDAIIAIMLFEESLAKRYGASQLIVDFSTLSDVAFLRAKSCAELSQSLLKFEQSLLKFMKLHLNSSDGTEE